MKKKTSFMRNLLFISTVLLGFSSQAAQLRTEESLHVKFMYNKHTNPDGLEVKIGHTCKASSILGASYCFGENTTKTVPVRLSENLFEIPPTTLYAEKEFLTSITLYFSLYAKIKKLHNPLRPDQNGYDSLNIFDATADNRKKINITDKVKKSLSKTVFITTVPEIKLRTSGEIIIKGMQPIQVNEDGDERKVRTTLNILPVDEMGKEINSNTWSDIDLFREEGSSPMNSYSPGMQIITTEKPAGLKYELLQKVTYLNTEKEVLLKSGMIDDLDNIDFTKELEGSSFVIRDEI